MKERDELHKELADMTVFTSKCKEVKTKIAALSEEIAELQFEEKSVTWVFDKGDTAGMKEVEDDISKSEARIGKLDAQEVKFIGAISCEKEKINGLKTQDADLDQDELTDARFALRQQMESETQNRIRREEGGKKINFWKFQGSISDADKLLSEDGMAERREGLRRLWSVEERQRSKQEARAH